MTQAATESVAVDNIRQNVRGLLDARGISVSELARDTKLSREFLSKMLNGKYDDWGIAVTERIAQALGVTLNKLISEPR